MKKTCEGVQWRGNGLYVVFFRRRNLCEIETFGIDGNSTPFERISETRPRSSKSGETVQVHGFQLRVPES